MEVNLIITKKACVCPHPKFHGTLVAQMAHEIASHQFIMFIIL